MQFFLLLLSFFQLFIKLIKFCKALQEDKNTYDHQNNADHFTDCIGNFWRKFIMKLLCQNNFYEVYTKISAYQNNDIKYKIFSFRILISHGYDGYQPKKYYPNIKKIQEKAIKKSFKIILTDELFLTFKVHFCF